MTATQIQSHIQTAGDTYREANRKIDHLIGLIQMADAWDGVDKFRELNQKLEAAVAAAAIALADWDKAIGNTNTASAYKVELASIESELDAYGNEVPVNFKTIDVVVTEPTEQAVRVLIGATDWLDGFGIVQIWKTEDGTEF